MADPGVIALAEDDSTVAVDSTVDGVALRVVVDVALALGGLDGDKGGGVGLGLGVLVGDSVSDGACDGVGAGDGVGVLVCVIGVRRYKFDWPVVT